MSESGDDVAKVQLPSGEHLSVKAPSARHWVTTIPIAMALGVAFAAGIAIAGQRSLEVGLDRLGAKIDRYVESNDVRVRKLEDDEIRRQAAAEAAGVAGRGGRAR